MAARHAGAVADGLQAAHGRIALAARGLGPPLPVLHLPQQTQMFAQQSKQTGKPRRCPDNKANVPGECV